MANEKEPKGYVVFIRAYATSDNDSYAAGTFEIMYCGIKGTYLGDPGFEPYKTEAGAERGRAALEKKFAEIAENDYAWGYQVGGVMRVTEAMYREMEAQQDWDFEVVRHAFDIDLDTQTKRQIEKVRKNLENARRRKLIKPVK